MTFLNRLPAKDIIMKNKIRSIYTFKGSWFEIFDKLVAILKSQNLQKFAIWESKSRNGENLLIVYGSQLTAVLQNRYNLKEITEPEFDMNFKVREGILKFMGIMNSIKE